MMLSNEPNFKLTDYFVGHGYPCYIIAEIGQNHQGSPAVARELIKVAKECGVNCVKLQKSHLRSRFTEARLNQNYNSRHSFGRNYKAHREKLELSDEVFVDLQKYVTDLGMDFAASGMDKPSIDFLNSLNVPFFKIGSADATNLPLLRHACKYQKPLLISTGMTKQEDLVKAYKDISQLNSRIVIMQCTSAYPAYPQYVNLNVIKTYKELFPNAVIGYSGHEVGIELSVAAVALGAKVLERHITLDHSSQGSDHIASLDPHQLKLLVNAVRDLERAMGSSKKQVEEIEMQCYEKLGKTIVASKYLVKGTVIKENMIDVKVAVKKGIDPINFYKIIGKVLTKKYEKDETIKLQDLKDP